MNYRNTKQKKVIMDTLCEDQSHPTIAELYQKVVAKKPVGQATVYRNVAKLVEEGKILKIPTAVGVDHYDGNCSDHCHLHCQKCGKIIDLFEPSQKDFVTKVESLYGVQVDRSHILLEGLCAFCNRK